MSFAPPGSKIVSGFAGLSSALAKLFGWAGERGSRGGQFRQALIGANGGRNGHERHGTRKHCSAKPRKRARCVAKRRAHR